MDESNFLIDTDGKMCIVDFEAIGLLPQSFASYTVYSKSNPFISKVARYLVANLSPLRFDEQGWCDFE